jgi:hypothetical protein
VDELIERLAELEGDQGAGEPIGLGAQLADIRTELVKLNKAVKKPKK